jgi:hypothetical protein
MQREERVMATSSSLNTPLPPGTRSGASQQERTGAYSSLIGHVRDIGQEAQNLRQYEEELRGKLNENHVEVAEVKSVWQKGYTILTDHASPAVERHLEVLRALMENVDPSLYRQDGSEITAIEDEWARVVPNWPKCLADVQPLDIHTILTQIDAVEQVLCEVVRHVEMLALPDRVNSQLKMMRVGQTIDFQAEYSDEIPTLQIQTRALNYLYDHPLMVQGLVDVENGLIYRVSPNPLRRAASIFGNLLAVVLGGVLIAVFYEFHVFSKDLTLQDLLTAYTFVMIGGVAHYVVNAVKQFRTNPGKTLNVTGDGLLWFHVKEVTVFWGILTLIVGSLGIFFLRLGANDPWTAFFAGYSIDSVIDLVLLRFADVSSTRMNTLKMQLAQPAPVKGGAVH